MNPITITLTESERQWVSLALAHFIDFAFYVPEVAEDPTELLELHSKFLTPEDITA